MDSKLSPLSWIHLSDIHVGAPGNDIWWNVSQQFEAEIKKQIDENGEPDIIIITGDIAFSGCDEQYEEFSSFLDNMDSWIGKKLPVICVPGNHDLARPDLAKPRNAYFKFIKSYTDGGEDVTNLIKELWEEKDASLLDPLFNSYEKFLDQVIIPRLEETQGVTYKKSGFFPGDIRVDIAIPGKAPLTIIGLNSAWIQCSSEDFYGKLAVEVGQLRELVDSDDESELIPLKNTNSILIMHHPYDWLHKKYQENFDTEIYILDRFDVCLCGHMHESKFNFSAGSNNTRRFYQAPSLFGLEYWGTEKEEREIGYTMGKLYDNGGMRVWPYRLAKDSPRFIFDKEWNDADEVEGLEICQPKKHHKNISDTSVENYENESYSSPNPYRFLKFYDISDGDFLCGREKETKSIVERVDKTFLDEGNHCFIGLTGRSGCGKSSLLRAGILSELQKNPNFNTIAFRPTDFHDQDGKPQNIIQRIIGKIHRKLDIGLSNDVLVNIENASGTSRARLAVEEILGALDNHGESGLGGRLVIGLDQFEEVIDDLANTKQKDNWKDLVEFINRAVDTKLIGFVHTLESTRKELAAHTEVAHLLTEFHDVDGYSKDFVQEIITRPFKEAGFPLDESEGEIVSKLVENTKQLRNEVKGDEADSLLPLLALSLARLFDIVKSKAKKQKTYDSSETLKQNEQKIGLEILDNTDLLDIKSSIKNEVQKVWSGDDEDMGHFLRPLLRISDISSDNFILRKAPIHPYSGDKEKAERFIKNRLLVKEGNRIRLVHEAVIRFWPEASNWLDKEKNRLKIENEFRDRANHWFISETTEQPIDDIDSAADILSSYIRYWSLPSVDELDNDDEILRDYCLGVFSRSDDPLKLISSSEKFGSRHVHLAASYNQVELLKRYKGINEESLSFPRDDGRTPIHAASWGSVDAVRYLLEEGVSAVTTDEKGWYPLGGSILMGNMDIYNALVDKYSQKDLMEWPNGGTVLHQFGATNLAKENTASHVEIAKHLIEELHIDPNEPDSENRIPLHWIAHSNHVQLFEYFSTVSDVNLTDDNGWNALHFSASTGAEKIIEVLLGHQKFRTESKRAFTKLNKLAPGCNPLHIAVLNKQSGSVDRLLKGKVSAGEKSISEGYKGRCALLMAANLINSSSQEGGEWEDREKILKIVTLLLDSQETDVNARDAEHNTALSLAETSPELLKILLNDDRLDPDIPISPNGPAPMLVSAELSDWALTHKLLYKSSDFAHLTRDNNGKTLCHLLVDKKAPKGLIKEALKRSPILSQTDDEGYTPLMLAILQKDLDLVLLMLEFGKGVKLSSEEQGSTLKVALERQAPQEIFDELIKEDTIIQLTSSDEYGWCFQHVACAKGAVDKLDWLLERYGIGLNKVTDHWGRIPFDLAPVSFQKKWKGNFEQQSLPKSWDGDLVWEPYEKKSLCELIQNTSEYCDKHGITVDINAECSNLSFYNQECVQIIRLSNKKEWSEDLRIYFISHLQNEKRQFFHLNGTSLPIHELNSLKEVLSIDRKNVLDYLRFFCFFVRGDDGAFLIAECIDQHDMPKNLSQENKEDLAPLLGPAKFFGYKDGKFRTSAIVYYAKALFFADFYINISDQKPGLIEMEKDLLIFKGLPANENIPIA